MDCIADEPVSTGPLELFVSREAPPSASATLCMNCEVRTRCLGGVAAEAGTTQLRAVLAGRRTLRLGETLYEPEDRFRVVHAVRSGSLMSFVRRADGEVVRGFHFPGEMVGVDGMASGSQRVTVSAMEDTQLCVIRFAPRTGDAAGLRAVLARLWDMMSCEVMRARAHDALLATLAPQQRVAAFLASVSRRMRGRRGRLPPGLAGGAIASYLRVPPEAVADGLHAFFAQQQ
jgi:CRP/FNR family transcriptional regulator